MKNRNVSIEKVSKFAFCLVKENQKNVNILSLPRNLTTKEVRVNSEKDFKKRNELVMSASTPVAMLLVKV